MRKKQIVIAVITASISCMATVQLAPIFTDNAVFQQNAPIRIWGIADPQETVAISFAEQKKTVTANPQGRWLVTLDPMDASCEPRTLICSTSNGNHKSAIENVLVGEVWLAGGQSNMAGTMKRFREHPQDISEASDPLLHFVTVPRKDFEGDSSPTPQWQTAAPQSVQDFSGSAYYFAKNLRKALGDVPIGIIACAVGGTPAEAWISRRAFQNSPELAEQVLKPYEAYCRTEFPAEGDYEKYLEEFEAAKREFARKKTAKETPNPRPVWKMGPHNTKRPGGLHETMLAQAVPYTVRGAIWYQGENNAKTETSAHYRKVFPALIENWRSAFQNSDMPFLFVQLPPLGPATSASPGWPELRDAQLWADLNVPNTGMAVLLDGGDLKDIHPHSKGKVGTRLALLARQMVYGETNLVTRGPQLKKATRDNGFIELTFSTFGSELMLKNEPVSGFQICGKDKNFIPARAELIDGKIRISSPSVRKPQEVRYAWKQWIVPTLFNTDGLPASPFRTDDFPLRTEGNYYYNMQ
ncbi:sialate O-acetylesterase [Tichowtungia aerotolerans]|uniref:Sialate O-acetylesterase domain-containing protein n=1 Tax=Tichowtungia aerotolerans TaxID=2697043 RepID=A0A6P1MCR8_9BACT|nr:sialate O-acetylesterase [Tichowtungia aerotolerans]QHI69396.1 hypothetical protein GT409_08000 [Tichowtungia aerotolerans]